MNTIKIAKKYSTVDGMKKGIKSVVNRATSWRRDVQNLAIATMAHTMNSGDWTLCRDLVEGISKVNGVNKSALGRYVSNFMHVTIEVGEDGETKFIYDEDHSAKTIDIDGAYEENWFDFKPAPTDKTKELEEIREAVAKMLIASFKTNKVGDREGGEILATIDNLLEARETLAAIEAQDAEQQAA